MKRLLTVASVLMFVSGVIAGCGPSEHGEMEHGHKHENGGHSANHEEHPQNNEEHAHDNEEHDHNNEGHAHNNDEHGHDSGEPHEDHHEEHGDAHNEYDLGTHDIGGMEVQAAQGGKTVTPGKNAHLVIKFAEDHGGSAIVRAWIGTEDRTQSIVAKGEYAPSHGDYDIHAVVPGPLPENAKWWIEIENQNGETSTGSIPLYQDVSQDSK